MARYSPLAKKYEPYRRTPGAEELRTPILKQLQAHGREYLSKGGFLDENGQLKSDNSEEFRTAYRNRKLNIGKTAKARTIRGTEVKIRYRVVEANDLNVSNQENGAINPEYPQELQPRQRDREASQQQIALMAANLDPELLAENRLVSDGAPVIGSDLVVESGNGRVLAIRRAYKTGAADEYKTWIADNAERFGLSSDEVAKVKQPVLVRERISDVDRVNFTSEANEASTARMSETETALNDAKKINQSMLTLFDPEKSIQANRGFIQQFVGKVLQQNERGDFFQKNGEISKAGINRIENALIAKAYNNSTILNKLNEVYDDDIKNITNALLAAAPKIAVLENGAFRKDLSIRDDVVQAINALVEIKGEKGSVADYLSQIRIFDDDISNEAKTLLRFFDKNKRSSKKIAQGLINYAEDAMTESKDNQGALPGMEDSNRSKKDILRKAIKDAENGVNTKGESYNQSASSYHETDDDTKRKTLSHIRRTNDAFVTQEQVEKYYQDGNTWHGTGNIILGNVFKMQYIGSNEGSTYRGWGIYSGEAKGTGEAYRKYGEKGRGRSPFTFEMYVPDSPNVKLTTRADFEKYGLNPDIAEYIQEAAEVLFEDTEFSDSILETNKKILNTLVEYFNDEISILENEISGADTIEMSDEDISTREEGIKSYEDVIDFLTSPNIERISFKQTNGNLYRIKVHHVEAYLDYDNKLNEAGQPKIVLDAVKKIIDNLKKRGINTTELEQAKTGGDFYWVLTKAMEWFVDKGKIKSQKHGKITRADMAASLMLNHHGVPGLKFWDALSREKKSGTHNFVTWNEDAITVEGISEDSNEDAIDYFTQMQEKLANAPTKNIDISDDSDLASDSLIERYNQLAYHGTGHTLLGNMFDFDKLGSGEGNQAFGWGAYFAKKLAVAESYRRYGLPAKRWHSDFKITTKDGSIISVRDNQTSVEVVDGGNIDKGVQEYLESIPNIASHLDDASTENIIKELEGYYAQYPEKIERIQSELDEYREKGDLWHIRENERSLDHAKKNYDALRKTIDIIADIKVPRKVSREGNIYEFDIPENKVLLDYDKDIDTQPAHVRKAIRKIREAFINMGIDTGRIDRAQTGQEFYDAVENSLAEYTRKNDIQDSINRSDKRASLFLNKFGIPGLRYLDDGSRNKGKGTNNYVIWDADSLKLMGLTEDSGQDAKDYYERTKAEHEQENSGESYNQIIGETGSGRLDNFEGNAQRRANLDLAKHMERNGNSASEIWAMTGWMRGAEGKWRYEIPDGKFNKQGLLKLARISRELFALDDKTIKDPNYVFTSAEQKEHDRLVDLFSNATLDSVVK